MKLRKVVIGIDFCDACEKIPGWTSTHLAPGAELILVHSVEAPVLPRAFGTPPHYGELIATAREGAGARLRSIQDSLAPLSVRCEVRQGRPFEQLEAAAQEAEADLIVAGALGRRRGLWRMLGSTVERLIQSTERPVLVARELSESRIRRILVPVDDSPTSRRALAWAAFLAGTCDSELIVLHAVTEWYASQIRRVGTESQARQAQGELEDRAAQWLTESAAAAGLAEGICELVVKSGPPFHAIVEQLDRTEADLIVMGSHGAGGFRAGILGSVARSVLRMTQVPVFLVERG